MNLPKPPFKNPVLTIDPSFTLRSTLVVKSSVDARIKSIYPKSGVLQTTINLLLDKLCYELDRCNLTEFDPGAYERAITGASIILDCEQRPTPVTDGTVSTNVAKKVENTPAVSRRNSRKNKPVNQQPLPPLDGSL